MSISVSLLICVCGGVGAMTRCFIDSMIKRFHPSIFPMSTLIINALAGFLFALALLARIGQPDFYVMLTTGFLGGLSTFSTAIYELISLAYERHWKQFFVYLSTIVLIPVLAVYVGISGLVAFGVLKPF